VPNPFEEKEISSRRGFLRSMERFLQVGFVLMLVYSGPLLYSEHIYDDFALRGFGKLTIGTVSVSYEIRDGTPDGQAFVGAEVYRHLNGDVYRVPFIYTETVGMKILEGPLTHDVGPELPASEFASGISDDGRIVVGRILNAEGKTEAFRYDVETENLQLLGALAERDSWDAAAVISRATGVSSDGSVVVGQALAPGGAMEAFRWTEPEGMVRVFVDGHPEFESSWAYGISADGSRICGFLESGYDAVGFYQPQGGELVQLPWLEGGSTSSVDVFAGRSEVMLGSANRSGLGPSDSEQIGVLWMDGSVLKTIPAPGPLYRLDPGSVSESLDLVAGSAISADETGRWETAWWRAFLWLEGEGTVWLDTFLSDRFEFEWNGDRFLRNAFVTEDGGHLIVSRTAGPVYRIPLSLPLAPSYRVFPDSSYREGIRSIAWLGDLQVAAFPWVHHADLGWVFIHPQSTEAEALWVFEPDRGAWLTTSAFLYPFIYWEAEATWLWHQTGTGWVYNYKKGVMETF
jgi:probable HAF family extracellular repeat protein